MHFVTRKITHTVAAIARGDADTLTLGNMAARRDWGWAPDYVEAMVLAARNSQPDDYVIATGESHSIAEFVEAAFAAVGISNWKDRVQTDQALMRPQDASELRGDASKAHKLLGWRPRVRFTELVTKMVLADRRASGC
ncbi:MAG: GDP-mannose 4,6-dehydratase [Marmoricola sp.]